MAMVQCPGQRRSSPALPWPTDSGHPQHQLEPAPKLRWLCPQSLGIPLKQWLLGCPGYLLSQAFRYHPVLALVTSEPPRCSEKSVNTPSNRHQCDPPGTAIAHNKEKSDTAGTTLNAIGSPIKSAAKNLTS
eukprot:scpid48035/ scgid21096/ 